MVPTTGATDEYKLFKSTCLHSVEQSLTIEWYFLLIVVRSWLVADQNVTFTILVEVNASNKLCKLID